MQSSKKQNIEAVYPLSPMQEGMLFHYIYNPESATYFEQFSCTLKGELSTEAFAYGWKEVIRRHPALRTAFVYKKTEKMLQVVHKEVDFPLTQFDWRDTPADAQAEKLEQFYREDREQGFKLSKAPLMRFFLIRLDNTTYRFLWSFHHLLTDGWSIPVILKEVFTLYESRKKGFPLQLASAAPYRNYIEWLQKQDMSRAASYWKNLLGDFSEPTPLTFGRTHGRTDDDEDTYRLESLDLGTELSESLKKIAKKNQLTVNTLIQASWAFLLSRYSGLDDIVFGATVSGRSPDIQNVENIVGLFINTLPLRIGVEPDLTIAEWLKHIQLQNIELRDFEYTPLVEVQSWTQVPRDIPLFNSIVVFENYPVDRSMKDRRFSLGVSDISSYERTNYPLTLVAASRESIVMELAYESRRFDSEIIRQALGHLKNILDYFASRPEHKLSQVRYLSKNETRELTIDKNATDKAFPEDACIHQIIEETVKSRGNWTAIVYDGRTLSYADLNKKANQLAHYLRTRGIGPEDRVGIYLERSIEMIICILGVIKAGGAYVPIETDYPEDRINFILKDSKAKMVLSNRELLEHITSDMPQFDIDASEVLLEAHSSDNPAILTQSKNLAYIIYTSGSTGKPKGILLHHKGLINQVLAMQKILGFRPGAHSTQFASIAFDASVLEIFGALTSGATMHIVNREEKIDPVKLVSFIERNKINTMFLPPAVASLLDVRNYDAMEVIWLGGDVIPPSIPNLWTKFCRFVNCFGPSEITIGCDIFTLEKGEALEYDFVPVGTPPDNYKNYILNDNLELVPKGVTGELHIGGVGLARGYLNRPELTAERFIPNPFSKVPGERLYKTGDLARWLPDGNIEFLGRKDFQIKIRGFRVELQEIEAILKRHEHVNECVVAVREKGAGEKMLVAYYVSDTDLSFEDNELKLFMRDQLPDYMIPSLFIRLEKMPLTSSGKINRRALPEPDMEGKPTGSDHIAPRNHVEELLASISQDILGVKRVGITDSFFDLGGHSLMVTRLGSRIRDAFGVEIPLREIFEKPTIMELASLIAQQQARHHESVPVIEKCNRELDLDLSFSQQRLWFLDQLSPENAFYNIPGAFRLQGTPDYDAVEKSLTEIVKRHESLRTTFRSVQGKPVQVIHQEMPPAFTIDDLSALPSAEQEQESRKRAAQEAQTPFQLDQGPLFRVRLLKLGKSDHVIIFNMHHIVSDGWSMSVLIQDFVNLYSAFSQKKEPKLPDLPIQYADYAAWQKKWLRGDVLEEQLDYWKEKIGLNPPVLELPIDFKRPSMQTFHGKTLSMILPHALTEQVKHFSRKQGVTLFMTLLAAFQALLHRYSNQNQIMVGSPIANRTRTETEKLIGFFVNTLVYSTRFDEDPDIKTLLKRVRETTLGAYAHQDVPFEQLVETLQPERDMSHSPLFQAAFILQNVPIERIELPGMTIQPFEAEHNTAKYDLTLTTAETPDGLACYLEYNTDLFRNETVERILGHYRHMLEEIITNPKRKIRDLHLLSQEEQATILRNWNATQRPYPSEQTVHSVFEEYVRKQPDKTALYYRDEHVSYSDLNEKANKIAHFLSASGVQPDNIVGLSLNRSPFLPAIILGILKAGAGFLSIDPSYPRDRISYILEDSGITVLISEKMITHLLPEFSGRLIEIDTEWLEIANQSADNLSVTAAPGNLAYVIYTSGSTGKPKGTLLSHNGLCNLAKAQEKAFRITQGCRVLQFASMSFDASVWETVMALLNGAGLVLADQEVLSSGQGLWNILSDYEITTVTLPPSVLAVMPEEPLPSLETIITAGEKCTVDLVKRWGEGRQFVNAYGPTETTVCASMYEANPAETEAPPIGKPIDNFSLYILDPNGHPVPVGVPGELHIAGVGLARGYLNRPDLTAEKFIPDPFSTEPGARLYRSGDLVRYLPDGNIEFLGRIDYQVKVRGFRIELGEIEAILGSLDQVKDVVVLSREDTPGDPRLVAYLVSDPGEAPDVPHLRKFLKKHLPEYMIPSSFIQLESMPLTPNGKVDRNALPAPEFSRSELASEYVAPRNEHEQKLVSIAQELLQIDTIGIHDNFFELGGHSLLATQFMSRIREQYNIELPLRVLFEKPTIAELTEDIYTISEQEQVRSAEKIERSERSDENLEELLEKLDQLSDDEVKALLKQEMNSQEDDPDRDE